MYSTYVLNKIKKQILHQNYLGSLILSKQNIFEQFPIFLHSVQGVLCGGGWRKFIAHPRIFKLVHRRVGARG